AGAIGTAFLVTVMTNQAKNSIEGIIASHGFNPADKMDMVRAANLAQVEGINDAFMVSTVFAVLALVLSFFIQRGRTTQEQAPDLKGQENHTPQTGEFNQNRLSDDYDSLFLSFFYPYFTWK